MDPVAPGSVQGQISDQTNAPAPVVSPEPLSPPLTEPVEAALPTDSTVDAKSQVVDKILNGKNILVTVGTDPSVDELASALGLSLLLSRVDKHVTSVFSGNVPPAIEFLDPEATFENSVDSLRDFIVALSKEKADKLRYKVEDDVVKIIITPYKTVLSKDDFEFSPGDFNVDVIVALGVEKSEELDKALTAHGRILHDAAVVTINTGNKKSSLGSINWNDAEAGSIAEMLVNLSDALWSNLLDEQISTALLTGIVAETNRFSNEKTTPKVMTISAQLMAAGANQQLVATNLRQEGMISESVRSKPGDQSSDDGGEMTLSHGSKASDKSQDDTETGVSKSANAEKTDPTKKPKLNKPSAPAEPVQDDPQPKPSDEPVEIEPTKEPPKEAEGPTPPVSEEPTVPEAQLESKKPTVIEPLSPAPEASGVPVLTPEPAANQDAPAAPIKPESEHQLLPDAPESAVGASLESTEVNGLEPSDSKPPENNLSLSHETSESTPSDQTTEDAIAAAREAVESAGDSTPVAEPEPSQSAQSFVTPISNPAVSSIGVNSAEPQNSSQPLAFTAPPLNFDQAPGAASPVPPAPNQPNEPDPIQAFSQTHDSAAQPADLNALTTPTSVAPAGGPPALPPMPPLPAGPNTALPPMPPLPGQPGTSGIDPTASFQPQINPGFMQDMPQSQNTWTQAADSLATEQADKAAQRQAKMDQMTQQYDTAVDRNRELQGLPPLNDPNGSGFSPVPPAK